MPSSSRWKASRGRLPKARGPITLSMLWRPSCRKRSILCLSLLASSEDRMPFAGHCLHNATWGSALALTLFFLLNHGRG